MAPSPVVPFSPPLGPLHLAPATSQQATISSARAVLSSFFSRRRSSASSKPSSSSSSSTAPVKAHPKAEKLAITLDAPVGFSSYSPSSAPPPPYSAAASSFGTEEDLVVLDESAHPETPSGRKAREKAEKLERKRAELIEADRRMDEELRRMGL
ncbi:hypothetical protein JCM8097_001252 [Rhodosporidiobolus ruineniae]